MRSGAHFLFWFGPDQMVEVPGQPTPQKAPDGGIAESVRSLIE